MNIGFEINNNKEEQEIPQEEGYADSQEVEVPDGWEQLQVIVYNAIDLIKQVTQLFKGESDKATGD